MKSCLVIMVMVVVLGFGGCVYGLSKANGWISSSEPSQALIRELEKHAEITSAVGRPIEFTLMGGSIQVKTQVSQSTTTGSASYRTVAYGPKGSIPIEADLQVKDQVWVVDRLKFKVQDGWKSVK